MSFKQHIDRLVRDDKRLIVVSVVLCFVLGCLFTAGLWLYDRAQDDIRPLTEGQRIDLTDYGFSLTVPEGWTVLDCTDGNRESGDSALFAGIAGSGSDGFRFYVYQNPQGDSIDDYPDSDIVRYYVSAGASEVRMRSFSGRRFITFRSDVTTEDTTERWTVCESWDARFHLVFETGMAPSDFLPIAASIYFTEPE